MKSSKFLKYASPFLALVLAAGSAALTTAQAQSDAAEKQYQLHGFLSQGFIYTDENNFYGESEDGGSFDYYEVGVNGIWQFDENLLVSGQLLARDAGETDDGKLRVDYLFADYRFINQDDSRAGARVGRVKNPIGFYNETRDVLFTRPSILLPQSVYFEGTGVREILFSSDGIQLYSDWDHGVHHTVFKLNFAKSDDVSEQTRRNFLSGGSGFGGFTLDSMRLTDMLFVQILNDVDGARTRYGLSYVSATLSAQLSSPFVPAPVTFSLDSDIVVLSWQHNQEFWSVTSEYSLTTTKFDSPGGASRSRSEGIYLQGEYRYRPDLTGLLRYDLAYGNRNDRGASDARDLTVGLSWEPRPNWLLMAEYHYIHGSNGDSSLPNIDNPDGASNRTHLLALMLGYRF